MASIQIRPNLKIAFQDILNELSKSDLPELERFLEQVGVIVARKKLKNHSEREIELVKKSYEKIPDNIREKYSSLYLKLQAETISEKEYKELQKLDSIFEKYRKEWLAALVELAQLRGISLFDVKKQLGLEVYDPIK